MQYRCYVCSFKLGDGIPPLEALSTAQANVVGNRDEDAQSRFNTLEGTPFEGMSTYSFCEVCLSLISACPEAYGGNEAAHGAIYGYVFARKEQYLKDNPEEAAAQRHQIFPDFWLDANRKGRLAWARHKYPNRDYSLVFELLGIPQL